MLKLLKASLVLYFTFTASAFSKTTFQETSSATFYHDYYVGRLMANGKKFSQSNLTAAHRSLPLGTKVQVINNWNQESVIVIVTDRCNCVGVDLSKAAFIKLAKMPSEKQALNLGRLSVKIKVVN